MTNGKTPSNKIKDLLGLVSPLVQEIYRALGPAKVKEIKQMWTTGQYDCYNFLTKDGKLLVPGDNCTCVVFVQLKKNYAYIFIYHKDSGKETVVHYEQEPKMALEKYEGTKTRLHKTELEPYARWR